MSLIIRTVQALRWMGDTIKPASRTAKLGIRVYHSGQWAGKMTLWISPGLAPLGHRANQLASLK